MTSHGESRRLPKAKYPSELIIRVPRPVTSRGEGSRRLSKVHERKAKYLERNVRDKPARCVYESVVRKRRRARFTTVPGTEDANILLFHFIGLF